MTEELFLEKLQDMMDAETELTMETVLQDVDEWDSLSHVSFITFGSTMGGGRINPSDVKSAKTVRDLYKLIQG